MTDQNPLKRERIFVTVRTFIKAAMKDYKATTGEEESSLVERGLLKVLPKELIKKYKEQINGRP